MSKPNIAVLGAQWGDEGKGKIVDMLTPHFSIVARYQGGHNAGHTVYVEGKKFVDADARAVQRFIDTFAVERFIKANRSA